MLESPLHGQWNEVRPAPSGPAVTAEKLQLKGPKELVNLGGLDPLSHRELLVDKWQRGRRRRCRTHKGVHH